MTTAHPQTYLQSQHEMLYPNSSTLHYVSCPSEFDCSKYLKWMKAYVWGFASALFHLAHSQSSCHMKWLIKLPLMVEWFHCMCRAHCTTHPSTDSSIVCVEHFVPSIHLLTVCLCYSSSNSSALIGPWTSSPQPCLDVPKTSLVSPLCSSLFSWHMPSWHTLSLALKLMTSVLSKSVCKYLWNKTEKFFFYKCMKVSNNIFKIYFRINSVRAGIAFLTAS